MDHITNVFNQLAQHYNRYSSTLYTCSRIERIPNFKDFLKSRGHGQHKEVIDLFMNNPDTIDKISAMIESIDNPNSFLIDYNILIHLFFLIHLFYPQPNIKISDYFEHALLKEEIDYVYISDYEIKIFGTDYVKKFNVHDHVCDVQFTTTNSSKVEESVRLNWGGMKKIAQYMDDHSMINMQCFEKSYNDIKEADEFNRINYLEAIGEEKLEVCFCDR